MTLAFETLRLVLLAVAVGILALAVDGTVVHVQRPETRQPGDRYILAGVGGLALVLGAVVVGIGR